MKWLENGNSKKKMRDHLYTRYNLQQLEDQLGKLNEPKQLIYLSSGVTTTTTPSQNNQALRNLKTKSGIPNIK